MAAGNPFGKLRAGLKRFKPVNTGPSTTLRTGLLLVHGIGSQRPSDTLLGFSNQLVTYIYERLDVAGWPRDDLGIDSNVRDGYVDLRLRGEEFRIREVYWAQAFPPPSAPEVLRWIGRMAHIKVEKSTWLEQVARALLKALTPVALVLMAILPLILLLFRAVGIGFLTAGATSQAMRAMRLFLADAIGDIEIYTSEKTPVQADEIRGRLEEALRSLQKEGFDAIYIVAHSLGTVIAFEALSRTIKPEELGGVKGFFSVGSPLDKIRHYFGHSYRFNKELPRTVGADPSTGSFDKLRTASGQAPEKLRWVNIYSRFDFIAGYIDLYQRNPDENLAVHNTRGPLSPLRGLMADHSGYWANRREVMPALMGRISASPVFQG